MHIRTNIISPQNRARAAGKLFDYFSVSIYENLAELLVHTTENHANCVRHGRNARNQIRHQHRDAHRSAELFIEDRAHSHSILARAEQLLGQNGAADDYNIRQLRAVCKRTLALKDL